MEEKFYFSGNGKKLAGVLSNNNGTDHVILICHGLGSNKDVADYMLLQKSLNNRGITTFRMDFLGHGESEGSYNDLLLTEAKNNVLAAIEFLKSKGYKTLGFCGKSIGGYAGLLAGSENNDFKYYVLISPSSNYDWIEIFSSGLRVYNKWREFNKKKKFQNAKKKAKLKFEFFKDYKTHDSNEAAKKINAPVVIIHGEKDEIVPLEKSKTLVKNFKNAKLKIMKGVDHEYTHYKALTKMIDLASEYAEEFSKKTVEKNS